MINKLRSIYSGKKIFITGHTGFKGAWLIKILSLMNAEIKGYALKENTRNDIFNLIKGASLCNSVIADINNPIQLKNEIIDFQPDFIFHLAAQPLVRLSYEDPLLTFNTNIIGTANLLNAVRSLKKQCQLILITTDKVYKNLEWEYSYRENDILGGYDPYSSSKAASELVVDSFVNSFFNQKDYDMHCKSIAVARAGNVIGGGDWSKDRLLPDIVNALSNNNKIIIRNPLSIRPWQHVLEPLFGYLLLASKLSTNPLMYSEAFNFGPEIKDNISVQDMVEIAITKWGGGQYVISNNSDQVHEAKNLKLDITKAITKLNWKPTLSSEKAIEYTINWYKCFINEPDNIVKFTESQIYNFFNECHE